MLGKTNALKKGVDTSDATATSNDILLGKTAYANDEKITGTIPTYNNEHENGYVPTRSMKLFLDQTKTCYQMFYNYKGTTIEDGTLEFSDTSNVTNMSSMFYGCSNLTTIPLLNTSKVTNMYYMFRGCSNLTTIPLLDTNNVSNFQSMFYNCSSLVRVPQLDTSKVSTMAYTFYGCTSLTEISALNVSNVGNFDSTFSNCRNLTTIHMTGMKVSFDISASTQFTDNDLHEIIDNLATVSSTQTLTMGATNLAKVKDTYVDKATSKGWTLA